LVNRDTLSRFGCNENLVISLGFLTLPGKLRPCPKEAACALGRQNLGKLLWDLAVEGKLLELREAQVAKAVPVKNYKRVQIIREYNFPVHTVPTHILSLFYALGPSGEMSLNFSAHQNKYSCTTKELIVLFCAP
jgi:hypothetical protein